MKDVTLEISGQKLQVRTDDDEAYLKSLASFVDTKMRDASRGQPGVTTLSVALTTALLIADELHKVARGGSEVEAMADRLSSRIEEALGGSPA
jgi:cell division protein ZapA (FtsZ GTPase activity inhibitor)